MRHFIFVIIFTLITLPIAAADYQAGVDAFERRDYASAFREFRPYAEQGDVIAQFRLGFMYGQGFGVRRDKAQSAKWYSKAAGQGHAVAQFLLGGMYSEGQGVPKDYVEAEKWYVKSARQGDAGHQYTLGIKYRDGWGLSRNYTKAYYWTSLAAAQGHASAIKNLDAIAKAMTPSQITEVQKMGVEWHAPKQPNPSANASSWQISDDANGQGSNAIVTVRLPTAKPSWASLIVDFGTVRNCSAGLGFLLYQKRDLGRHKKSKKNPDVSMVVSIEGKRWDQNADGIIMYENGFEVAIAIRSQELLDALAYGREATVIILVRGVKKAGVIFDIRGGINAINPAHDRCRNMIR